MKALNTLALPADLLNRVILGAVVVGGAYWFLRGTRGVARDVVGGAAGAVVNASVGAIEGIGEAVGIPRTNQTECQKALAEGRTWDASFACPAGTFLKGWLFGSNGPSATN